LNLIEADDSKEIKTADDEDLMFIESMNIMPRAAVPSFSFRLLLTRGRRSFSALIMHPEYAAPSSAHPSES
jgi:hypothetical protein